MSIPLVDLPALRRDLEGHPLQAWLEWLPSALQDSLSPERNGNLSRFQAALAATPSLRAKQVELARDTILIGAPEEVDVTTRAHLWHSLRRLMPWRKGPFEVFGIHIDTEWRSDWKWARVMPHLAPLHGRDVLDVGCGSGYHLLRMRGAGARLAIGVDPSLLFTAQFALLRQLSGVTSTHVLPLPLEGLRERLPCFDSVFSMGVIYHRRDPLEHLTQLAECLKPGGQLILEGLVIEGGEGEVFYPAAQGTGRYAMMRNVWAIPSPATLQSWVEKVGFVQARVVDVSQTTTQEQRRTAWMTFQSLADFLDPHDPSRTVEGYPAPRRAILVAERKK